LAVATLSFEGRWPPLDQAQIPPLDFLAIRDKLIVRTPVFIKLQHYGGPA